VSRVSRVFDANHKALIAYVTVGYPSIDATLEIVPLLAKSGCDIVELGIPFSDPLADGATIQKASFNALHNGVTPASCLDVAGRIRHKTDVPMIFMSYFNPIMALGLSNFVGSCVSAGVNGLIVPDLPPEEGTELEFLAGKSGMDLIYLLAPTSTLERIDLISRHSTGFIYLVSVAGVTGTRGTLPTGLKDFVAGVRRRTRLPLSVGFGISTAEQAREVSRYADGVIVGSRLVQMMEGSSWRVDIAKFVGELRTAMDKP
jgi:tryptophan synthase alpha chain